MTDEVVGWLLQGRGRTRDAGALAYVCGLELCPEPGARTRLDGRDVVYDSRAPIADQQHAIARCVAEHALRRFAYSLTDERIDRIARAVCASRLRLV